MVATTRARSSPSSTCTFLSPKQEETTTKLPKTRAHARAAVIAQKLPEKEEHVTRRKRKCSQKSSAKKETLKEADAPSEDEAAELDSEDDYDPDYEDDSEKEEDETPRKKLHLQRESPCVVAAPSHYESLRLQRIAENQARMAALGVEKQAASITSFFRAAKPKKSWTKSPSTPLELRRRSERLKTNSPAPGFYSPRFSRTYADEEVDESPKLQLVLHTKVYRNCQDEENIRPGNAPLPKNCPADLQVSPVISALRCRSKERGTLYDAIVGICCHFCRQKKLCGEEDCERCGQRDVTKACLGKSDCSKCHSSTGVFCRACLKIRYGEDIEQVRERGDWLCPHCSEEEGSNPYWICNSSICLSRRKIPPTGIAIYKAREMGYESVAHYLAAHLKKNQFRLPTV